MAGANSVASVDPASTTKSYTKPTVYIAPAASITQSGELLRLGKHRTMRTLATVWQLRRKVEAMTAPDRGLVCQQPRLY